MEYNDRHPSIYVTLALVFIAMFAVMFLYELTKQLINPDITIWESHIITIIFTSITSVIIIYFPLRSLYREQKRTKDALIHQQEAEKNLDIINKKLNLMNEITRHDINNQLTVLMGYLTLLKTKQPETIHNIYYQNITSAAKRISAIIQFTKEYEDIGITRPVWQDTRTLVDTAAKEAPLGQSKVNNDLPAGAEIFADPLIAKVYYNLMDNAVRYGGKITTIRFSVEERDGDKIIVCEDDGVGVPAEEKEQIFNRGFGKNTGLGLALSREILSITDITIRETGEPGKGARFEIVVPKSMYRSIPHNA